MKILNLYACLGGNRNNWDKVAKEAGIHLEVTAVELDPRISKMYKYRFPQDKVITTDAHKYLLENYKEFDFIWSSPPCPTHSKMMKATKHDLAYFPDMKLYEEIIFLDNFFKGKYVVENVVSYYKPLIQPYKSTRHYYWANFVITNADNVPKLKDSSRANRDTIADYLGFNYPGENIYLNGGHDPAKILRNCVHPLEGEHIFRLALNIHKQNKTTQTELF
jgi:DNA (cytosine-5)-methyltransferase 1